MASYPSQITSYLTSKGRLPLLFVYQTNSFLPVCSHTSVLWNMTPFFASILPVKVKVAALHAFTGTNGGSLLLKCDGTRAETRFHLSAKRTSPFKSAGASVQSTTSSRGVRISSSNAEYTKFRGSVKCTGYPLHSPVSPSLPLPFVAVCHHISTGL
jgi:hypothetical protein